MAGVLESVPGLPAHLRVGFTETLAVATAGVSYT